MLDYDQGPAVAELRAELRGPRRVARPRRLPGRLHRRPRRPRGRPVGSAGRWPRPGAPRRRPPEFGGRGASVWEQTAVREEMWAHHEPRGAQYMGVNWVGPAPHAPRHPEQQTPAPAADRPGRGHLVPGLQQSPRPAPTWRRSRPRPGGRRRLADQRPEDLDLLRHHGPVVLPPPPARRVGKRQPQGITMFLLPMDTPGIEVRPIPCMLGPHHLNEVFLDDVGHRRRRARHRRPRAGTWCRRCSPTSGSASPGYAGVEAPAAVGAGRPGGGVRGRRCLGSLGGAVGPDAGARPPSPAAGLPGADTQGVGLGAAGRHRRLPHRATRDSTRRAPRCCWTSPFIRIEPRFNPGRRGPPQVLDLGDGGVGEHRDAADPPGPDAAGGGVNLSLDRRRPATGRIGRVGPPRQLRRSRRAAGAPSRASGLDLDLPLVGEDAEARRHRRAAGWGVVADPVAERLARMDGVDAWRIVDLPPKTEPRGAIADLTLAALGLTLPCWTLLGLLDRADAPTTVAHVTARHQFGQPLSSFQGVQFQLTDAEVDGSGSRSWPSTPAPGAARRRRTRWPCGWPPIEAAEVVFRVTHQVHGAIGFCDETTLSWQSQSRQRPAPLAAVAAPATRRPLRRRIGTNGFAGPVRVSADLRTSAEHRGLGAWCRLGQRPRRLAANQTGGPRGRVRPLPCTSGSRRPVGGGPCPIWPAEWGGGMTAAEQAVLFQELAAAGRPRLVAGVRCRSTTRRRRCWRPGPTSSGPHLPAILDGRSGARGSASPRPGPTWRRCGPRPGGTTTGSSSTARSCAASRARHADWCLLLARTGPAAPKRKGISYFLLDMRRAGRRRAASSATLSATPTSARCSCPTLVVPDSSLVGPEHGGWQVAQDDAERRAGLTMLELAERLAGGWRWLVDLVPPIDPVVARRAGRVGDRADRAASLCWDLVERSDAGTAGPADVHRASCTTASCRSG